MSSATNPPTALPAAALSAAQRYVRGSLERARKRGERIYREGGVTAIEFDDELPGYIAKVSGTGERTPKHSVDLQFLNGTWFGECTCNEEFDCEHCYAAMREVVETLSRSQEPENEAPKAPPAAPKGSFVQVAEERLGRSLSAEERPVAETVDRLYTMYRTSRSIAATALFPIFGQFGNWVWQMFEVWPKEPKNPWEAWLYLAHLAARENLDVPEWLARIAPADEVQAFIREWERGESIRRWQETLRLRMSSIQRRRTEVLDCRAVLDETGVRLECRSGPDEAFKPIKTQAFREMIQDLRRGFLAVNPEARPLLLAFSRQDQEKPQADLKDPETDQILNHLLRTPGLRDFVVNAEGRPFTQAAEKLTWKLDPAESEAGDYRLALTLSDGSAPPRVLLAVQGDPSLYVTADCVFEAPPLHGFNANPAKPNVIPAPALETKEGVLIMDSLGVPLPPRLAARVIDIRPKVTITCTLEKAPHSPAETLLLTLEADLGKAGGSHRRAQYNWEILERAEENESLIVRIDQAPQQAAVRFIEELHLSWNHNALVWQKEISRKFPQQFAEWLSRVPAGVEVKLDSTLETLREAPIAASVKLDVDDAGMDWFDLRVVLDVSDTTLTQEELKALLDARGQFIRIEGKGWRRLHFDLSEEDDTRLADLGLSAHDFSSEPQRLHALQLAGKRANKLLPEDRVAMIQRRAEEIQARVTPPVPATIQAELRPYQVDGFHFLAYLSTNHFGGILADDMGLGKTLQTLAWLAWLRDLPDASRHPSLVVCPKSVMENWHSEAERFLPGYRVRLWRGAEMKELDKALHGADLLVVNYTQLRNAAESLNARGWLAVILDEGQYIKNPESQTSRAACELRAAHRLVLSGTPIENRLLDLWSLMRFAMPGMLGKRTHFARTYDRPSDPLGRRRLSARVRPFVLRRTKGEVARDLPERIEEDLVCDMEGEQATLYRAELKRARQHLLKLKTNSELEKHRFNFLASLLRLRQICCHPALIREKAESTESAKLSALMELLEPLVEEGQKVLVFSQFVGMLNLIEHELTQREWKHFKLVGETENRGELVQTFQNEPGAATFLISLKAGGFGLNLTAASYVVLFDPWWNPAVENQAIDRTHRIGQSNTVFAYRLLIKDSIEEKVRELQRRKSALAGDILGEESFARNLTLDDFQFLLSGE